MNILIAEDDPVSRKLLTTNLTKWDHNVIAASDGDTALKMYEENGSIRMAILDWMMPGKDGVEICRIIKNDISRPYTYIIMLTAKDRQEDIVHALEVGADDYVNKPFGAAELRARINAGERIVNLETALQNKITELKDALAHIKTLQGILPICMHCHKIRTDQESWQKLEAYIEQHSGAEFSHGICPECMRKYYPEIETETK